MSWISGPCRHEPTLVTVAELLAKHDPVCGMSGPAWSRCMRGEGHLSPCAALGTDANGSPVVVTWYRVERFPISGVEPGA